MNVERILRIIAGAFVLGSLAMGRFVNPNWYYFTAFVGLNLLQSGFTNWCPMISILKALGVPECTSENSKPNNGGKKMEKVVALTDSTFETEVLKSEIPVAVDFWASWCGPCRMLAPIMEEVAAELEGKVKVCKVNVDDSPATASKYGIQSIPTVLIFKNGELVDQFTGARPKQAVIQLLNSIG